MSRRAERTFAREELEDLAVVERVVFTPTRIDIYLEYGQYPGEVPAAVHQILGEHELRTIRSGQQGQFFKIEAA